MDQSLVDAVAALQIGGLGVKRMVKMLQATGFERLTARLCGTHRLLSAISRRRLRLRLIRNL